MKVALVKPPGIANLTRGVGFYTDRLYKALKEKKADVTLVEFSYFSGAYREFDLVHFPYFDTFFLTLPFMLSKKSVVTVHDLIPLLYPKEFPRGIKGELKWQIQKKSLYFANGIITVSQASKRDIEKITGIKREKIKVTYEASDPDYRRLDSPKDFKRVSEKYGLPDKFLLYVGDVNFNKNIPGLLMAFARTQKISGYFLVLAGKAFKNETLPEVKSIMGIIEDLKIKDRVILPGFVPPEDLIYLYNLAKIYIQPSIHEGFGLPVVEAMSCGIPVICGKNSSLPEVGGEAAIYTEVADPKTFAETIDRTISLSEKEYKDIVKSSILQSEKFSWTKTAGQTYEIYEEIMDGH